MDLVAFNSGCNILAIEKNNKKYAMTCAWASMVAYDKVGLLVGSQSETGKILEVGDVCGISALAKNQKAIAEFIGNNHSSEVDKFKNVKFSQSNSAIYIDGAKVILEAQVAQIIHLDGIEDDNYIVFNVLSYIQDSKKKFLSF